MNSVRHGLAAAALLLSGSALAGVNIVFHPIVEMGEWELEARGFVQQDEDPAKDGLQVIKADIAYGVNAWWWTELEFIAEKAPGSSLELEAIASENVFQFSDQGEYFADFGGFFEYERETEHDVNEIVFGPIVQKDWGALQGTANLFFERQFGSDATEHELEVLGAGQLKYRAAQAWQPGVEYYGDENSQNFGPGLFGGFKLGGNKLKYEVVALFGLTDASADNTFRWLLEYEFR